MGIITLALASALMASSTPGEAEQAQFEAWLTAFRVEQQIPSLSVIVLHDGAVVQETYLGWSDDEGDVPTSAETSYYIASVTKPLAGTALFLAGQDGELDLDAPLSRAEDWQSFCNWFPNSPIIFAGGQIEDVSIPDFSCQGQTLQQGLNMRVNGEPGTGFIYNPLVYARLSRFVDEVHDRDFVSLFYDRVLDPAGMQDSAAGWRDAERGHVLSHLAPPFALEAEELMKQAFPDDDFRAAAGLYTTARDLARFDQALTSETLMSERQREHMWATGQTQEGQDFPYVNGWYVQHHQDERLIWHSGWEPQAYSALYLKLPERGLTLIALGNTEALYWGNRLDRAEVERSELVQAFFAAYAPDLSDGVP